MTLLAAIAQMEDGIAIDQFLYEIMVIWSAVHELEIDLLIQVYELVAGSQSGKIPYSVFVSVFRHAGGDYVVACLARSRPADQRQCDGDGADQRGTGRG